jgi:PilZ domain-containing protein
MALAWFADREGASQEGSFARTGGTVSEARTGKRFPLELPIKIHKESASGDSKGTTGNLSAAGVYIRADASLEIGSPVEFEITLPPDVTGGQENVVIQCKGRVVRTDPTGASADGKGVACVIDSYEFVRNT